MDFAVLASGAGTNLAVLIERSATLDFGGSIACVISDQPDCGALRRAERAGIPTVALDPDLERIELTTRVCEEAADHGAEALVLAGFMRILGPEAIARFPHRIVNVHPSLLPAFPGRDAVQQALDYGVTITGLTVHLVDEHVDHGPIVAQRPVPIRADDDAGSLHARIQEEEHRIFPRAVHALVQGRLVVEGRRVIWR